MNKHFFATCPKGLEQLLEEELHQLGALESKQTVAGVAFKGPVELAYRVCLWSRLANRLLLPLASFPVQDADSLYKGVKNIHWANHMNVNQTFMVNFKGVSEHLKHTQFAAQLVKDAIVDQFRTKLGSRPSVDKSDPDIRINGMLRKGIVTISIDLSGDSLHQRGYRLDGGVAPLKENLAAAILYRAKWPEIARQGGSLLDPMCGSGTLLIEAVLMAANIAPGIMRNKFGFHGWKQHQPLIWDKLIADAKQQAQLGKQQFMPTIDGYDIDNDVISQAKNNIERAGLSSLINVETSAINQLIRKKHQKTFGLCVCNPPYGQRLEDAETLLPLYRMLSIKLKENFLNWEAAIITGNVDVAKKMGLRAYKKYVLFNGTIPCELLLFHIKPEWFITPDD